MIVNINVQIDICECGPMLAHRDHLMPASAAEAVANAMLFVENNMGYDHKLQDQTVIKLLSARVNDE